MFKVMANRSALSPALRVSSKVFAMLPLLVLVTAGSIAAQVGGTVSGTVTATAGGAPISGATVTFDSSTAATDGTGFYSFTDVPAGTYPSITASAAGYNSATATGIVVTDGNTTTQDFSLDTAPTSACLTDTSQADFAAGVPTNVDLTTSPGDVLLLSSANLDQENTTVDGGSLSFDSTSWFAQSFTPGVTGQLIQVDIDLLCTGCTGTTPNITVSIRAITAGDLPAGADLATATIPGFSSSSDSFYSATFASPPTLTAGTKYAIVVRSVSNPSAGSYAYMVSAHNPYSGGRRSLSSDSGGSWSGATPSSDAGFKTSMNPGFSSGDLVSSLKDSNPAVGRVPTWPTLSWTASTPANTTLRFQAAASNSPSGPFNFVGPDGTAATFFTTSGASLAQFNGYRYLKYKAYLATTDSAVTPALNDVTVCYADVYPPDLSLTKSDGGASVAPGGTVGYTLTYANAGNGGATGVVLTETVPANTTFNAGASTAGWVCSPDSNAGSTCTLAVGALAAASGDQTATFAVTVVGPAPAGVSQIANTASIADDGANGGDPTPGDNSSSDTTPLTGAPDLSLTKSDGGASTTPGGTVAYTLTYANSGNRGASGVVLTETVPANTTFAAGSSTAGWFCTPDASAGSTCTLAIGGLAAGSGDQTATFAVTVVDPAPAGLTQISNTASIADDGANGTDPTPGNNSGSDTTAVTGAPDLIPDLSLTKSDGDASVAPGGTVAYTLTYANIGTGGATGVVLTETVPANTAFNAGASTAGWVCTPNGNAGSTCTLAVGAVAAGDGNHTATFAVTANNSIPGGVVLISNTASIADDGTNGTDPTPANNSGSDTTPITGAQPFTDYYSVLPCRLLDTRLGGSGGPIASGVPRTFNAVGVCGVPVDASAIFINLTVVNPPGAGFLTLYPGNGTLPVAASITFKTGVVLSNNAIIPLATNGAGTIGAQSLVGGGGGVDLVIDVFGYFK